jgi:chemotaxis protein methyltransferase CheR
VISLQRREVREDSGSLDTLCRVVFRKAGMDLRLYKEKYLRRRVAVRLRATGCAGLEEYVALLKRDEGELERLVVCLTIHVSTFFRNPSTFRAVEKKVFPALFASSSRRPLRFRSVGCARGEEPYSLAILLREHLGGRSGAGEVTIEAIDIDEKVLSEARGGVYRRSRLKGLDPSLEKKYFTGSGSCRLVPEIRNMVTFRRGDVLTDPPEGTFDFVLCRNLLIYIEREAQEKIVKNFSSVLRPGGFLALGRTEVLVGSARESFEVVDARERVYRKAG